ncbi:MAG: adenylate/guanylate cyclase domain-containing protein [Mariprofundaceae bacterium]|nr:adenylate/guanylate cyclase domain-containing protein [Mariprofundaceae bacterium]
MTQTDLPLPLYQHIASHTIQQLEPAWLQLEKGSERIIQVGGAWQYYCQQMPQAGQQASDVFDVLIAMLPISESFELPQVQLQDGKYTDIFGLCEPHHDWLLFCDVTQNTLNIQQYHQISNDFILLKAQMKQTLHRYIGHEVSERIAQGEMQLDAAGERKTIATLFVDIRGFTPFNERHDAQMVMQTLNDYMNGMLPAILQHHGMVDKIMGDGVMAVFGVLPSENHCCLDAFHSAKQIIQAIYTLNQHRLSSGLEQLGIGVGIASGEAVLGILGSHERRAFTAIGRHVNLAARLESNARVGEILIDKTVHQTLGQSHAFTAVTLTLKGIGQSDVFSRILPCIHGDD